MSDLISKTLIFEIQNTFFFVLFISKYMLILYSGFQQRPLYIYTYPINTYINAKYI